MDNYELKNRISEALSIRNMKAVELCEKSGVKKASLSHWISQHWQPKQKPLLAMAKVLDVSEMWLAGYNVPMERPIEQKRADELATLIHQLRKDSDLLNLVTMASKLSKDQRKVIEGIMSEFTKSDTQE
jgi:transcriptional regulator with XRE-family HTH domain